MPTYLWIRSRLGIPFCLLIVLINFVCSAGDMGVGKSCLLQQFTEKRFPEVLSMCDGLIYLCLGNSIKLPWPVCGCLYVYVIMSDAEYIDARSNVASHPMKYY